MTTSTALGGAVGSLKWNGKELLASGGHGSFLQWAFHAWHEGAAGSECYNPNQGGSREDDQGPPPCHGPSPQGVERRERSPDRGRVSITDPTGRIAARDRPIDDRP